MTSPFHEQSYSLHSAHLYDHREEVPSLLSSPDSIDALRHRRMYQALDPLIDHDPSASWLTIGDSGADAAYLSGKGVAEVCASSISDWQLKGLAGKGMLRGIQVKALNAERLDLPDASYDYVLCKEAFHHLPRAPVGFYEMIRVARKAVALIEPAERRRFRLMDRAKILAKSVLKGLTAEAQMFESSGNFLFRLSDTELIKQATGLQLSSVALRFSNDFYHPRLAKKPVADRKAVTAFRTGVWSQDLLCQLRLMNYGLVTAVVFKAPPDVALSAQLQKRGFSEVRIPRNPYLEKSTGAP